MYFFDHNSIFFSFMGYSMSYLEFFGTLAGGIAVWLSAKGSIWSWPIGIANVVLFFFLFYQIQLYPDMFLQAFFFITNLIGWWRWAHPREGEEDMLNQLRVTWMERRAMVLLSASIVIGTFVFGLLASSLHTMLPVLFPLPSAYPFLDSFVLAASIAATYLMVQKKVECWAVWILTDAVATGLYFTKGIVLVSLEYLIFCGIAGYGLWKWNKEAVSYRI